MVVFVAAQRLAQGVHGSAVEQISAQPHGKPIQSALFHPEGQQIRQGLGGVEMPSVSGVDDRAVRGESCCLCRPCHRVANDENIRIVADDLGGILQAFPFGYGGGSRIVKADDTASQPDHGSLEGHLGPGGGLVEQGRHDLPHTGMGIPLGMLLDIRPQCHDLVPPGNRVIVQVDQMLIACFHRDSSFPFPPYLRHSKFYLQDACPVDQH